LFSSYVKASGAIRPKRNRPALPAFPPAGRVGFFGEPRPYLRHIIDGVAHRLDLAQGLARGFVYILDRGSDLL
jgi:hypothetical protein